MAKSPGTSKGGRKPKPTKVVIPTFTPASAVHGASAAGKYTDQSKATLKAIVAGETSVPGITIKGAKLELARRKENKPWKDFDRARKLAAKAKAQAKA